MKPIAKIDEKYKSDSERWVLCTVHFGWHRERETCEDPKDDSSDNVDGN